MFPSSIPRSHATRAALALALTLAAPACSTAPIAPPDDPPPPLLEIAMTGTGDGQGGVEGVALPLPLQVRVTQGGAPVAGVPIRWTTTSGSLTVSGSFTNHLGIASMRWTPGTIAEDTTVTATAALYTAPDRLVRFHATLWPRVEARRDPTGLSGAVGTVVPTPVRVVVTRGNGQPVEGVPVDWLQSWGSVAPTRSFTDHNGVASTSWRLGTWAGSQQLQAKVRGHLEGPVRITAAAIAGPATSLQFLGEIDPRPANFRSVADTIRAKVTDRYGNPIAGQQVTWHLVSGSALLTPVTTATDPTGIARAHLHPLGVAGPVVVRATASGAPAAGEIQLTFTPPEYVVHLAWGDFVSPMNGTSPAVDTIPVGTTMRWVLTPFDYDDHGVEPVGTPSFTGGKFPYASPSSVTVTFTEPGTYHYHDPWYGGIGTVVVQ